MCACVKAEGKIRVQQLQRTQTLTWLEAQVVAHVPDAILLRLRLSMSECVQVSLLLDQSVCGVQSSAFAHGMRVH